MAMSLVLSELKQRWFEGKYCIDLEFYGGIKDPRGSKAAA